MGQCSEAKKIFKPQPKPNSGIFSKTTRTLIFWAKPSLNRIGTSIFWKGPNRTQTLIIGDQCKKVLLIRFNKFTNNMDNKRKWNLIKKEKEIKCHLCKLERISLRVSARLITWKNPWYDELLINMTMDIRKVFDVVSKSGFTKLYVKIDFLSYTQKFSYRFKNWNFFYHFHPIILRIRRQPTWRVGIWIKKYNINQENLKTITRKE